MPLDSANHDVKGLTGILMAGKPINSRWDLCCKNGLIESIKEHQPLLDSTQYTQSTFLAPSLCHPHIHLDKCFLLSHPKYADLEIKDGDFAEALRLTSRFVYKDPFLLPSHSHKPCHRRSKVSV